MNTEKAEGFRLGASKQDVTPPAGLLMAGYGSRDEPARGTHMPLWARAFVCTCGGESAALVAVDVVGFSRSSTAGIRKAVTDVSGIPGDRVLIATTHTHAGPVTTKFRDVVPDPSYMDDVTCRIAEGVRQAAGRAVPVSLGIAQAQAPAFHHNRRNPDQPIDSTLVLARFVDAEGRTVASWVNYGSHPTILTGDNLQWSPDWPGVLCDALEAGWGGIAGFFNGCLGDVGPHRPVRDFSEVARVGQGLAEVALEAGADLSYTEPGTLAASSSLCVVPLAEAPDEAALRAMVSSADGPRYQPAWAADQLRFRSEGLPVTTETDLEVQTFRIGGLDLACFPGQLFGGWGLELRRAWPHERLMVVNQANDHAGYFPTEAGWEAGGYEAKSAFMFNSDLPAPMTWQAGEVLLAEAGRQFDAAPPAA